MRLWALVLVAHLFCFNPRICKRCDSSNKEINVDARGFNPRICKRCDQIAVQHNPAEVVSIHASVKDATMGNFRSAACY